MPWVRLHSVKGYYDIPSIVDKFENIKLTVNIVPSLLEQIIDYSNGNGEDYYLTLSKKPANKLTKSEKLFIIDNFFSVNHKLHLTKGSKYKQLFDLRTNTTEKIILETRISLFSEQSITDLQMLFNLSWFGFTAKEQFPEINMLLKKNGDYSNEEVLKVLEIQQTILKNLIPLYKKLQKKGKLEISVSPYYHPILPLIYDTETAKRCMPEAELPPKFSYTDDAEKHISEAISYFETIFGKKPQGMWPSEGSVSPEILQLIKQNGISWIATDEEILKNSGFKNNHRYSYIYKPYSYETKNGKLNCIFRDKNLSDMIGFRCHQVDVQKGIKMFFDELNSIKSYHKKSLENLVIGVVLDGENPWEYYEASGEKFLTKLFSTLEKDKSIEVNTISETLNNSKKQHKLETIHSGSWINADFKIWIGHNETNKAWTYLLRTREFYKNLNKTEIEKSLLQKAFKELMIAEGSDWFWWFGDDFTIKDKDKFDSLFRQHLTNVYAILKHIPPSYLNQPIAKSKITSENLTLPKKPINIQINGKKHSYFKWIGAGKYSNSSKGSAMYQGESLLTSIQFGFNETYFFLKLNNRKSILNHTINIILQDSIEYTFNQIITKGIKKVMLKKLINFKSEKTDITCIVAYDEILEIAIPYDTFEFKPGETLQFLVEIITPTKTIYRTPSYGMLDTEFKGSSSLISYWTT